MCLSFFHGEYCKTTSVLAFPSPLAKSLKDASSVSLLGKFIILGIFDNAKKNL